MIFSEKSASFARKILKHYQYTESGHNCSDHCSNHQAQTFQPFQHMHDHRKERQIYEKPTKQKLENMKYFKEMGNNSYKQKKYDEAAYFYNKVIVYSDYTFPQKQCQIAEMQVLVQQANMNLAMSLIKLNQWTKAVINLRQAVKGTTNGKNSKIDSQILNTKKKGYFWLTKYFIHEASYQQANQQIQLLSQLNNQISTEQEVSTLKAQVERQLKKYERNSEDLSKKMFKQIL